MAAEIIDLWLARRKLPQRKTVSCMYKAAMKNSLIDKNCQCADCREFFKGMQRSTQEIMRDLGHLQMSGRADEGRRLMLINELQANSDPFNW